VDVDDDSAQTFGSVARSHVSGQCNQTVADDFVLWVSVKNRKAIFKYRWFDFHVKSASDMSVCETKCFSIL